MRVRHESDAKKGPLFGFAHLALARRTHRSSALILTYHGVLSQGDDSYANRDCVSAAQFDRQMAYIARNYSVIPLPDLVACLASGVPLPQNAPAITFDDGFRNNSEVAVPILRWYGLPATVFLTTAFVSSPQLGLWTERVDWLLQAARTSSLALALGDEKRMLSLVSSKDRIIASDLIRGHLKTLSPKSRQETIVALAEQLGGRDGIDAQLAERHALLTWEQIRQMARQGTSFGSHTHAHAVMSTLSPAEAHFEIRESKRLIENQLQMPCSLLSAPAPYWPRRGPRDSCFAIAPIPLSRFTPGIATSSESFRTSATGR